MKHSGNNKELELVRLIQQHDTSAMRRLYDQYIGYLTAICSRYVLSKDDISDILQDSFIKFYTSADQFEYRGEGSLKAWMVRIVVNESLKFLKRNGKFSIIKYEWDPPDYLQDNESNIDDIPASVIQDMIRHLPTGYRTVFNLYIFEQKSHKEIAAILNITESTSASQLHRAKNILAKEILQYKLTRQWKKNG